MYDEPIIKNMKFFAKHHIGFNPYFQDLVGQQNGKYNDQ
jgi:hypothetical protein